MPILLACLKVLSVNFIKVVKFSIDESVPSLNMAPCYKLQTSRTLVSDEHADPGAEGSIVGLIGCL